MIHLLHPGDDSYKPVTFEELRSSKSMLEEALWIDLFQPTEEEEKFVEKILGVDLPSREEMGEIAESSRLFEENGVLYLSCWLLCLDSSLPQNSSAAFILTPNRFVSIRHSDHHPIRIYSSTRNRLQTRRFQSGEGVFVDLLDNIAGHIASMLRLVEQDLNSLSEQIFSEQKGHLNKAEKLGLKRIVQRLGKRNAVVANLRESSVSLSTLMPFFNSFAGERLKPHVAAQLKSLERDIKSLRQYDGELSSEIAFLLDSTVGLINFEQNQSMKILSVAAVLVALI
ncbi:MAG TPA: CorA family divalent cation transporter [Chthoniobacter sp.]|jgi:magnesium transporter